MNNLFFFTRVTYGPPPPPPEEGQPEGKREEFRWTDCFNMDKMIRSMEFKTEIVLVLDDGYEAAEEVPVKDKKNNISYVRQRVWHQSEIHLTEPEDIDRFKSLNPYRFRSVDKE